MTEENIVEALGFTPVREDELTGSLYVENESETEIVQVPSWKEFQELEQSVVKSSFVTITREEVTSDKKNSHVILPNGYSEIIVFIMFSGNRSAAANFQTYYKMRNDDYNYHISNVWMNLAWPAIRITLNIIGNMIVVDHAAGESQNLQTTRNAAFAEVTGELENINFFYSPCFPVGSKIYVYGR